jgi:hypothetical protein
MRGETGRRFRALAALLGGPTVLLIALTSIRWAGGPRSAAAQPAAVLGIGEPGGPMYVGAGARARGDLAGADAAYRLAWRDPALRAEAASALQDLHRTPGFKLPVDETQVVTSAKLLGTGFRRSETPHFVVLSDCPPDWTQGRAQVLERTRDQFFRVAARMGAPVYPHKSKLLCILFARRDDYTAFARAHDGMEAGWIAGYYATLSNRIVFYNDSTSPAIAAADEKLDEAEGQVRTMRDKAGQAERDGKAAAAGQYRDRAEDLEHQVRQERGRLKRLAADSSTAKATHEATHLLAFNTGLQLADHEYPFWVSEGLATNFETDHPDSAFGPDRGNIRPDRRLRFDELRESGKLLPLADLVARVEAPSGDAETADAMYSEAAVLFSTLYARDPRAIGAFLDDLATEPATHLSAERALRAFLARFGDPEPIERRMLRKPR